MGLRDLLTFNKQKQEEQAAEQQEVKATVAETYALMTDAEKAEMFALHQSQMTQETPSQPQNNIPAKEEIVPTFTDGKPTQVPYEAPESTGYEFRPSVPELPSTDGEKKELAPLIPEQVLANDGTKSNLEPYSKTWFEEIADWGMKPGNEREYMKFLQDPGTKQKLNKLILEEI